ncbi:prepilin-type N-terminal cleavage/methylation domain-containing protein [Haliovirga abyssi]|uniref:Prepilin-type N-terminal cleavage/methylation domain-containing protein n=1 Tax=Haliovirga abyssi TaxID=2996794 RepID=A0AAU9D8J3_9FUSO|nr:prepilin-type N-terminal cleavage/methylation domain-containing protein [Haliovirga abyssi]BDU49570.1 prepilin-type N-terminal cleavage/methylation domain-containing protein [Haliovirga abyssi]
MKRRMEKGFTLVELMIVVAIIAILAAVAIPQMGNQIRKAKDSAALGSIGAIRTTVSVMMTDNGGVAPSNFGEVFNGITAANAQEGVAIASAIDTKTVKKFGYTAATTLAGINVGTGVTAATTYTTNGADYKATNGIHKISIALNTADGSIDIDQGGTNTDTKNKQWNKY